MLTLARRADSVSAYVAPQPKRPDLGQVADIVGVTGCREPVAEGPEFVGGHGFCNHATADGLSYCPYHQRQNVASYSRKLISQTLAPFGLRYQKRAA